MAWPAAKLWPGKLVVGNVFCIEALIAVIVEVEAGGADGGDGGESTTTGGVPFTITSDTARVRLAPGSRSVTTEPASALAHVTVNGPLVAAAVIKPHSAREPGAAVEISPA